MTVVDYDHFLLNFSHPFAETVINSMKIQIECSGVPNLEPAFFAAHGNAGASYHYYHDSLQLDYKVLLFMTL
jgi:hypothetical protein